MRLRDLGQRLERTRADRQIGRQVGRVERYLNSSEAGEAAGEPLVLFFNASTRIHTLSLNAAFSLLASWSLRLSGVRVQHIVCMRGMEQCILGTRGTEPQESPPCRHCMRFSQLLYPEGLVIPLRLTTGAESDAVARELKDLPLDDLAKWHHRDLPLGKLCLPGLRWALRSHSLPDDMRIRRLYRQYLRSAAGLVHQFERILEETPPRALVVFNGIMYPEAVARAVALRRGVPVATHEVGLRPCSAFFSHDHATFRQVDRPNAGDLEAGWEERVDAYLEQRRRGSFSMAGIQFWPEMRSLPSWLEEKIQRHRQLVPIFTNVIFDTSQAHANALFADMFDWLEVLEGVIAAHPDTLFVVRAHPDEDRPGKASRESVAEWFGGSRLNERENAAFIPPSEYLSSYELIERAKCVLVYSSSVGLEASILGVPVLCAGRARYTRAETVFFPGSRAAYMEQLESLLAADRIETPASHRQNAKAFLYHELYHASLDLSEFLRPYPSMPGMVLFSDFEPQSLASHPALAAIRRGLLEGAPFVVHASEAGSGLAEAAGS